jgi:hypothetical protein
MTQAREAVLVAQFEMTGAELQALHKKCDRYFNLAQWVLAFGAGSMTGFVVSGTWQMFIPIGLATLVVSAPFYYLGRASLRRSRVLLGRLGMIRTALGCGGPDDAPSHDRDSNEQRTE